MQVVIACAACNKALGVDFDFGSDRKGLREMRPDTFTFEFNICRECRLTWTTKTGDKVLRLIGKLLKSKVLKIPRAKK